MEQNQARKAMMKYVIIPSCLIFPQRLLKCRASICEQCCLEPKDVELSMGMSNDFEHAVSIWKCFSNSHSCCCLLPVWINIKHSRTVTWLISIFTHHFLACFEFIYKVCFLGISDSSWEYKCESWQHNFRGKKCEKINDKVVVLSNFISY